jgi:hypothetical protein
MIRSCRGSRWLQYRDPACRETDRQRDTFSESCRLFEFAGLHDGCGRRLRNTLEYGRLHCVSSRQQPV